MPVVTRNEHSRQGGQDNDTKQHDAVWKHHVGRTLAVDAGDCHRGGDPRLAYLPADRLPRMAGPADSDSGRQPRSPLFHRICRLAGRQEGRSQWLSTDTTVTTIITTITTTKIPESTRSRTRSAACRWTRIPPSREASTVAQPGTSAPQAASPASMQTRSSTSVTSRSEKNRWRRMPCTPAPCIRKFANRAPVIAPSAAWPWNRSR